MTADMSHAFRPYYVWGARVIPSMCARLVRDGLICGLSRRHPRHLHASEET